jgi:hypothetical protein
MSEQTIGEVLAELRALTSDIGEVKHSQKNIQISVDNTRDRLSRIEVKQENAKEAVDRAFETLKDHGHRVQKLEIEGPDSRELLQRLEATEKTIKAVDGEQKKWFHYGCAVAGIVSLVWIAGGAYFLNQITKVGEALDAIPQIAAKQKRQDAINRIILKKIGSEVDIVE